MDKTTLEMVIHSLIFSNIDYCVAIFHNLPAYQFHNIQWIQNYAARILTNTGKFSHITPVLKELHWFPVQYRIKFKILITTFKCLHDMALEYLSSIINKSFHYERSLRSSDKKRLIKLMVKDKVGERSFHFSAPSLWNELPYLLTSETSFPIFKSKLKTYFFNLAFS